MWETTGEENFNWSAHHLIWGRENRFGISQADRRHHLYAIGKTTMLRNMIIQDIEAGQRVGLIDPHGDLAEELLDYTPSWRTEDVVLLQSVGFGFPDRV